MNLVLETSDKEFVLNTITTKPVEVLNIEEAKKQHEECIKFLELYNADGTAKRMPIGFTDTSLYKVRQGWKDLTNEVSKELVETIIDWIDSIKYVFISKGYIDSPAICSVEVERLGKILGCETKAGFIYLDGRECLTCLSKWDEDKTGMFVDMKLKKQDYIFNIYGCSGERFEYSFKTTMILDEVRKHWELSKEIDGLVGEKERLK